MIRITIMTFIMVSILSACTRYSISNIDVPPPKEYESWEKSGATKLDVKIALLECGAISVNSTSNTYKAIGITDESQMMNHFFMTSLCMENSGFSRKWWGRTVDESCNDQSFPERKKFPSCQPNVEVPVRSIERRIDSWHCRVKTDYVYCLRNAFNTSACKPDNQKHPPEECLLKQKSHESESVPEKDQKEASANGQSTSNFHEERALEIEQDVLEKNAGQMEKALRVISH